MRMRKLGKGQSVMFCGPMEVERKILHCSGKTRCDTIEVADVLQWSISETSLHTKKCIPLWATQGFRYQRRHAVWSEYPKDGANNAAREIAESLLETEAQTLQDRYGFDGRRSEEQVLLRKGSEGLPLKHQTQLEAIRAKCREFQVVSFNNATLREEQERELSPENEQERQVERPRAMTPCKHRLHKDVRRFVQQGILDRNSDAFLPAFKLFCNTTAIECFEVKMWPTHLLVTADFARTLDVSAHQHLDNFLRPVHWVVSGKNRSPIDFVLLSPYEAHELLPCIRQHYNATLHVYSPRVSRSVSTLEDLSFCAIPAIPKCWPSSPPVMQLNLFAGQLYLRSHEDYLLLCRFLGLCFRPPSTQTQVEVDGFVSPTSRPGFDAPMERECPFTISPIGFLRVLMALRRKGQNYQKSDLGRILCGELLAGEEFEGRKKLGSAR
jgi:hypothetical protein